MILRETSDFSHGEYESMIDYVEQALERGRAPSRSREAIKYWLDGTTIAPKARDWNSIANALTHGISPDFTLFQYAEDNPISLYFNYRLYLTIRQGVMRFLRQSRGEPSEDKWVEADPQISLSPEYQIVFNHFLQDLTVNYALARITSVNKIPEIEEKNHPGKGVIIRDPSIRLPMANVKEICEDMHLFGAYLKAAAEKFPVEPFTDNSGRVWFDKEFERWAYSPGVLPYLLEYFGEPLDVEMKLLKAETVYENRFTSAVPHSIFGDRVRNAILSGEMDEFFKFPRGSMMRLLESYFRTRTAVPNRIYEGIAIINSMLTDFDERNIPRTKKREIEKQKRKLKEKYGIEVEPDREPEIMMPLLFLDTRLSLTIVGSEEELTPRQYIARIHNQPRKLLNFLKEREKNLDGYGRFLTRTDVVKTLGQYNLSDVIDIREEDFYFERLNFIVGNVKEPEESEFIIKPRVSTCKRHAEIVIE